MTTWVVKGRGRATVITERVARVPIVRRVRTPVKIPTGAPGLRGVDGAPGAPGQPGIDAAGQTAPIPFAWGDAARVVYTPDRDGVLAIVRIQYTQAFNGAGASVVLGTAADPDAAMPAAWNHPYSLYEFENSPDLPLAEGEELVLTIQPGTASAGAGLLFLTFLPTE